MFDLIQWRARKTPEAPALFFNGRWYSYRDLEGRANRLANRLLELGVTTGDRVSVIARNHPVHFDLLLAAPKIGFVYAPLNPQLPEAELLAMAAIVKPVMVFADSRHHGIAAKLGVQWTRLSDYREWLPVGSLNLPRAPALTVESVHMLLPTAAGLAELPYRQVLLNARHAADGWGLSAQDSTVHCLPCYGTEINLLCLPLIYRGGRVVLMSGFDTDEYLGHLALHRVSVAALSPPMLRHLTQYSDFGDADLSSLNWVASVGAPASVAVRQALAVRGVKLRLLAPLAEAGPNLFLTAAEDTARGSGLLGKPMPDVEAKVCADDGQSLMPGAAGELRVSGSMLFKGYCEAPDATRAVLDQGQLRTGLAVRLGDDGQYQYLGRCIDAIGEGSARAYPGEIEFALLQSEGVAECAAIADPLGAGILAVLVMDEEAEREDAALAEELRALLPQVAQPSRFQRLRSLPRDAWGEIDRAALVESVRKAVGAAL